MKAIRSSHPALIITAESDVLHDEGVAAGVDATHVQAKGTLHGFASCLGLVEARVAVRQDAEWLDQRLSAV